MSIFLDYKVKVPSNLEVAASSWNEEESILAVATKNSQIHFYGDEVRNKKIMQKKEYKRLFNYCRDCL